MTVKPDWPGKPGTKARAHMDKQVNADEHLKDHAMLELENEYGRTITVRQKTFAELYVEGRYSAAECARQAGFSPATAGTMASKLVGGKEFPHVVEYIAHLRKERERLYGVTTIGQLERLYRLSMGAEQAGQYSAAINAEKIRSALGGLTVDRREQVNTIDQMSRDQITARLMELQQKYPQAFDLTEYVDITNEQGPRGEDPLPKDHVACSFERGFARFVRCWCSFMFAIATDRKICPGFRSFERVHICAEDVCLDNAPGFPV
jgi:hypothetical protein